MILTRLGKTQLVKRTLMVFYGTTMYDIATIVQIILYIIGMIVLCTSPHGHISLMMFVCLHVLRLIENYKTRKHVI